jgi:hypothetical protein
MMTRDELQGRCDDLRREATLLAGGLSDLSQRATVYRHLFLASGGNHAFPLIAAHGALWAGGYFRFGMRLGAALSWQYVGRPAVRRQQLQRLADFADVFRDINRRVCVDTYVNFHFTDRYGQQADADRFVPRELLDPLNRLHAARRADRSLSDAEKQTVFEAHFRHEQAHVVGPTLTAAVADFDWPLLRAIALRPWVKFAYFPGNTCLRFRNFASADERIERGLQAFSLATQVGWSTVDAALQRYRVLPPAFFAAPAAYFADLRTAVLAAGC